MTSHGQLVSGITHDRFDTNVSPRKDFFRYVNGTWLKNFEIPADRASYGSFAMLREKSELQVRQIIEDLSKVEAEPGSNAQKIGDLFRSFMTEERFEALGISPVKEDIAKTLSVESSSELLQIMGELEARGLGGLFYIGVEVDAHNSNRYVMYMSQGGISLPDEAYYREEPAQAPCF